VNGDVAVHANEFLAASHVLAGSPQAGKDVFAKLIATNPAYAGPDAAVFKPEVVDVYTQARRVCARTRSRRRRLRRPIHLRPLHRARQFRCAIGATTTASESKPIYKKWWFYAGAAAVIGGVALAAGGGGDGGAARTPSGSVSVGVTVQ
jgi:hypothetical protein